MLKELEALRKQQKKHDEEMEDLRRAHENTTLEVPTVKDNEQEDDEDAGPRSARKASAIEEFTVSELLA